MIGLLLDTSNCVSPTMSSRKDIASLYTILSNELLLLEVSPYLPVSALLSLAGTSKSFRYLIYNTPGVFRYLNLSTTHGGPPRSEITALYETDHRGLNIDELPPREAYTRDLRNIFDYLSQKGVLKDVTTLVLDRLNLPSVILSDLLCTDAFNIRILSIRRVKLLSQDTVMRVLRYLIRPSRPEGCPKLKGLYFFGSREALRELHSFPLPGVTNAPGARLGTSNHHSLQHKEQPSKNPNCPDLWYYERGRLLEPHEAGQDWAHLLQACSGIIAFNAVLCRRCLQVDARPRIATISLGGCASCKSAPEGAVRPGIAPPEQLPLVEPPPTHRSTVRAAQMHVTKGLGTSLFIARCDDCLKDRWCQVCNDWWCESCYTIPSGSGVQATELGSNRSIKVHNGLCVENCLVEELYTGGGEGGMWG